MIKKYVITTAKGFIDVFIVVQYEATMQLQSRLYRCDLYNIKSKDLRNTKSIDRNPLSSDYKGGIFYCEKKSQCKLQKEYNKKQKRKIEDSINSENTDKGHYLIKKINIPIKKDGRILCEIKPIFGTEKEAGNEEGYAVGVSSCFPKSSSMKIKDGENLTVEFIHENKYTTGFMGHFYIYLAEHLLQSF
ncbi:hypothetical protein HN51_046453 [Arachis hypogaea]